MQHLRQSRTSSVDQLEAATSLRSNRKREWGFPFASGSEECRIESVCTSKLRRAEIFKKIATVSPVELRILAHGGLINALATIKLSFILTDECVQRP
jgi:hypothetical protein